MALQKIATFALMDVLTIPPAGVAPNHSKRLIFPTYTSLIGYTDEALGTLVFSSEKVMATVLNGTDVPLYVIVRYANGSTGWTTIGLFDPGKSVAIPLVHTSGTPKMSLTLEFVNSNVPTTGNITIGMTANQ